MEEQLPSYLTKPVHLIRLLKSPADPPTLSADFSSPSGSSSDASVSSPLRKIDIASQAWTNPECRIWKKNEIIGEWVIDSWGKCKPPVGKGNAQDEPTGTKKGKGKLQTFHPVTRPALLDERYHNLLAEIVSTSTIPSAIPLPRLVASFFTLLHSLPAQSPDDISQVLRAAYKTFSTIISSKMRALTASVGTAGPADKAEDWLEALGAFLKWAVKADSRDLQLEDVGRIMEMIKTILEESLRRNLARKKLTTTNTKAHLASIVLAYQAPFPSSLQTALASLLSPLIFPLEVLQSASTSDGMESGSNAWHFVLNSLVAPLARDAGTPTLPQLVNFIPALFAAYISSLKSHRYSLFTASHARPKAKGGAGGDIPLDVWVMAKVREGTLVGCRGSLEAVTTWSTATLEAGKGLERGTIKAIKEVWQAVASSGVYFEGDVEWRAVVRETLSMVVGNLHRSSEVSELNSKEARALAQILVDLDFEAVFNEEESHGRMILKTTLTSSTPAQDCAIALLLSILRFHTLTQSVPAFIQMLAASIEASVVKTAPNASYQAICNGPLTSPDFLGALQQALQGSFTGGISAERGWGSIILHLGQRIAPHGSTPAEEHLPVPKKRKVKDGILPQVDSDAEVSGAIYGLLSRLMYQALVSAQGKGADVELNGCSPEVLAIVEQASSCWTQSNADHSWASEVAAAGQERMSRAASELGWAAIAQGNGKKRKRDSEYGEFAFERLQTLLSLGPAEDSSNGSTLLAAGSPTTIESQVWSGRLAGMTKEDTGPAVWHLVSHYGLKFFDENGSDDELRRLINAIMKLGGSLRKPGQEVETRSSEAPLSMAVAVYRLLHNADFWELPRLRSSVMAIARETTTANNADAISGLYDFFTIAPTVYATVAVRNQLGAKAAQLLREPAKKGVSNSGLAAYLLKIARDADVIGDEEHLLHVFGMPSDGPVTSERKTDSEQLQDEYLRILTRDIKMPTMRALAGKVVDTVSASPQAMTSGLATRTLDTFSHVKTTDTPDILRLATKLTHLAESLESHILPTIQAWDGAIACDTSLLARSATVLLRSYESANLASISQVFWPKIFRHVLDRARSGGKLDMPLVLAVMELQVQVESPQAQTSGAAKWLAAWMTLRSAVLDDHQAGTALDAHFALVLPTFSPESYEVILDLLNEQIGCGTRLNKSTCSLIRSSLVAMGLVLQAVVEGTGKVNRANLDAVLESLRGLSKSGGTGVTEGAMGVAAVIAKEKAASLVAQDVAALFGMCLQALLPIGQDRRRSASSAPAILSAIISITASLVRQRRDLVVELLPLLMCIHARVFSLFSFPRRSGEGIGRAQRRVLEGWPSWIAVDSNQWMGKAEAREFARVLAGLSGRSTIRTMVESAGPAASGTMVGELGKHAPALLVAYTRAVASPFSTIGLDIRRELEPGLFALCEAISSGGKALFGLKGGESSGDAFGLGEGGNADAEYEVWGDLWRRWRAKRYTGGG